MRPNPTCPVCDHGATDAASIRVHNEIAAERGCRVYPFGRWTQHRYAPPGVRYDFNPPIPVERPAAWLNREFGAFAPALLGRVPEGER